jgi:hypothetical protein
MPGLESLATLSAWHGFAQVLGLVLLVLMGGVAAAAFFLLPRGRWPAAVAMPGLPVRTPWFAIKPFQVRTRWLEIVTLAAIALLIVAELAAYGLGRSKDALLQSAHRAQAEKLQSQSAALQRQDRQIAELNRQGKEADARRAAERARAEKEIAGLQRQIKDADNQFVEFQRSLGHRRLSKAERQALIAALQPFAGQKVTVASTLGDEESRRLAEDFVAVFDAAGWDHNGEAGISVREWDRDPVGVEITLNEADARETRISAGIGALINVVRRLGLTKDNTIYMNGEVAAGEVQVKVGRRLRN